MTCKCLYQHHRRAQSSWQLGRTGGASWALPKEVFEASGTAVLAPLPTRHVLANRGSVVQAGFLPPSGIIALSTSNPHAADVSQPRLPTWRCCFEWGVPSPAPGDAGEKVPPRGGEPLAPANLPGAPLWLAYKGLWSGLQRKPAALPHFLPAVLGNLFPKHWWEMRKYRHGPGLHWNESKHPHDPALPRQACWAQLYGWEGSKGSNCSHMVNGPISCV